MPASTRSLPTPDPTDPEAPPTGSTVPSGPTVHAVILAGGIGSRFWPASTPVRPKQLLPLASRRALVEDALLRARALVSGSRLHLLAGADLTRAFQALIPGLDPEASWVEPQARGTGPVLTWAAHRIFRSDPEGIMISLHADHRIEPLDAFVRGMQEAVRIAAATDLLLTVGVVPDRPETGFGWILPGAEVEGAPFPVRRVDRFVEKPDRARAEAYLAEGLLWNSGIFVWPVRRFLEEVRAHAREIAPHLGHLDRGEVEAFFDAVTPISVDEAVLERSPAVGVVPAPFAWDDVGSWSALPRTRPADAGGNVTVGPVRVVEARENVVWAEEGPVVLFGVEGLVVVQSGGVTVVAPRDRAADWKTLLDALPPALRNPTAPGRSPDPSSSLEPPA